MIETLHYPKDPNSMEIMVYSLLSLIMGNAGFISSAVVSECPQDRLSRTSGSCGRRLRLSGGRGGGGRDRHRRGGYRLQVVEFPRP